MDDLADFTSGNIRTFSGGAAPRQDIAPRQVKTSPEMYGSPSMVSTADDIRNDMRKSQETLNDVIPGSPTHVSLLNNIAEAQKQLVSMNQPVDNGQTQPADDPLADFSSASIHNFANRGTQAPFRMDINGVGNTGAVPAPKASVAATATAPETPLSNLLHGVGGLADTVLNTPAQVVQGATYGVSRALGQSPEEATATGNTASNWMTNPVGKAFGITDTPGYQNEASKQALAFVGEHIGKGADWLSQNTGLPKADIENMMGTLSFAAPAVIKGAGSIVGDAASQLKDAFAQKTALTRIEPTMSPGAPIEAPGQVATAIGGERPGAQSSTAAQNGAPQLPTLANATPEMQKAIADLRTKGTYINPEVLARHVEADTLPVPVKYTDGQAFQSPSLISDEMNGRGKANPSVSPDFYNKQGKALGANLDAIRAKVAPDIIATHPTDLGQIAVDSYKNMNGIVNADIANKYQALKDANGGKLPLNPDDFVASADKGLADGNVTRFLPTEVKNLIDDMRGDKSTDGMNYNVFENYRTILGQQSRKAARAGDGTAEHAIGIVRNALESLPMTNETAAIKPLADAARDSVKTKFDKISADPAYKAVVNDETPAGEPSPIADRFINNFVTNGVRANIKQMKLNLANEPLANQAISAATIDSLKAASKADPTTGKFLADPYNKSLASQTPKLDDLVGPESAQQLKAVGNVAKNVSAQPAGSFVNNSNSLTGALSDTAKTFARGFSAVKTVGLSLAAEKAATIYKANKAASRAVAPAAGVTRLSDVSP